MCRAGGGGREGDAEVSGGGTFKGQVQDAGEGAGGSASTGVTHSGPSTERPQGSGREGTGWAVRGPGVTK